MFCLYVKTLVVNLALYPVLRTLGFQIHSAITGSYVPGYHSVLLINCPTEQIARDIGRYTHSVIDKHNDYGLAVMRKCFVSKVTYYTKCIRFH